MCIFMQEKIKIKGATSMTEVQQKFKEKIKKDLNYEVDFATYHITRGRGWSKADGAC